MLTQGDTSQNQTHPYRVRHYQKAMAVFRESISPARFSGPLKILPMPAQAMHSKVTRESVSQHESANPEQFCYARWKKQRGSVSEPSYIWCGSFHLLRFLIWKKKTHKRNNKYTHIVFGTWHPFLFVHPLNVFWFNTVASICITVWNAHICIEMWGGGNSSFIPCYICKFAPLQNNEEVLISVVVSF